MCQIIYVKKNKKVNLEHLDQAQKVNKDGYGVMWFEDNEVKVFKTMKYNRFKQIIKTLTPFEKVLHLRNTTRGATNIQNAHPFNVGYGYMMHNGTIGTMYAKDGKSDSQQLAKMITDAGIYDFEGSGELLKQIVGTTINRLVFMNLDGEVTIINENLGVWEKGIWYSNEYHVCPTKTTPPATTNNNKGSSDYMKQLQKRVMFDTVGKTTVTTKYVQDKAQWETEIYEDNKFKSMASCNYYYGAKDYHEKCVKQLKDFSSEESKEETKTTVGKHKIFVYGTLKRGYSNHGRLSTATFLGKAYTKFKWAMINNWSGTFPYLLQMHTNGDHIKGEVFLVDDATLTSLDQLEGNPTHYKRIDMEVHYNDAKPGDKPERVLTYVKTHVSTKDLAEDFITEWRPNMKQEVC